MSGPSKQTPRPDRGRFTTAISEVTLGVEDIGKSVHFYGEILGLLPEMAPTELFATFWVGTPEDRQRLILASRKLPPLARREDADSKATRTTSSGSLLQSFSPAKLGCTHYAMEVPREELEAALSRLREHGIEVTGPLDFEWMKARSYICLDPDGNLVELWSPNPESL